CTHDGWRACCVRTGRCLFAVLAASGGEGSTVGEAAGRPSRRDRILGAAVQSIDFRSTESPRGETRHRSRQRIDRRGGGRNDSLQTGSQGQSARSLHKPYLRGAGGTLLPIRSAALGVPAVRVSNYAIARLLRHLV